MSICVGVGNKARRVKRLYIGIDGKARKIKKVYIGVNGKARLAYSRGTTLVNYLTISAGGNLYDPTTMTKVKSLTFQDSGMTRRFGTGNGFFASKVSSMQLYKVDDVTGNTLGVMQLPYPSKPGGSSQTDQTPFSGMAGLENGTCLMWFRGGTSSLAGKYFYVGAYSDATGALLYQFNKAPGGDFHAALFGSGCKNNFVFTNTSTEYDKYDNSTTYNTSSECDGKTGSVIRNVPTTRTYSPYDMSCNSNDIAVMVSGNCRGGSSRTMYRIDYSTMSKYAGAGSTTVASNASISMLY